MLALLDSEGNVITYPYSEADLKRDNPNTSIPARLTEEVLNFFNVVNVIQIPCELEYDPDTEVLRETNPVCLEGLWYTNYEIISLDTSTEPSETPLEKPLGDDRS